MKKSINLTVILFFTSFLIFAQRYTRVIKWEVNTHDNNLVFGIAKDKAEADQIMDRFQEENSKKHDAITNSKRRYARTTIQKERKYQNIFVDFNLLAPKGYVLLNKQEIMAFDAVKEMGIEEGLEFFLKNKKMNKTMKKITELTLALHKYRHKSKFYAYN